MVEPKEGREVGAMLSPRQSFSSINVYTRPMDTHKNTLGQGGAFRSPLLIRPKVLLPPVIS